MQFQFRTPFIVAFKADSVHRDPRNRAFQTKDLGTTRTSRGTPSFTACWCYKIPTRVASQSARPVQFNFTCENSANSLSPIQRPNACLRLETPNFFPAPPGSDKAREKFEPPSRCSVDGRAPQRSFLPLSSSAMSAMDVPSHIKKELVYVPFIVGRVPLRPSPSSGRQPRRSPNPRTSVDRSLVVSQQRREEPPRSSFRNPRLWD